MLYDGSAFLEYLLHIDSVLKRHISVIPDFYYINVDVVEPLLLIDKSSLCGGSRFPFSLSEWSLTICLTPYNRR